MVRNKHTKLQKVLFLVSFLFCLSGKVAGQSFVDATIALQRGDFEEALQIMRILADQSWSELLHSVDLKCLLAAIGHEFLALFDKLFVSLNSFFAFEKLAEI